MPTILPPGLAKKIPAGSKLVFEMHYTPNGTAQKDRSSLGLVFAKGPVQEVHTVPIFNAFFRIPAGADNHRVDAWYTFKRDARVIAFMPHMHVRGKDFLYEAVTRTAKRQRCFRCRVITFTGKAHISSLNPLPWRRGAKSIASPTSTTRRKNPNNPDPTRAVYWGDQTWEEMMIGWLDYVDEPGK